MFTQKYSSIIHNYSKLSTWPSRENLQTTHMSTKRNNIVINDILHSIENKWTMITRNHMDESLKYNINWKNLQTREYMMYDSSFTKTGKTNLYS